MGVSKSHLGERGRVTLFLSAFLRFSNIILHEEWVLPKNYNFILIPQSEFTTGKGIGKISENSWMTFFKICLYLASFASMNSIVEAWCFIPADSALNGHEGVGRLFMRPVVELGLFRIIRWGCRFYFDRTCASENLRRWLSHDKQS